MKIENNNENIVAENDTYTMDVNKDGIDIINKMSEKIANEVVEKIREIERETGKKIILTGGSVTKKD